MKKIFFIGSIILAMSIVSCEKKLELDPLQELTEAAFFKTASDFEAFANQFYSSLPSFSNADDQADITLQTGFNAVSNSSYVPTDQNGTWNSNYSRIWQTSYLIQKISEAAAELKPAIAKYEGEARFFRAFAHYDLLRLFGGIPIVDKALGISANDILFGPRNTRAETVNFILGELDKAIAVLPADGPANDNGRITKWAALALKARVSLFEASWRKFHEGGTGAAELFDKAIDASNQVIASNVFQLFDRRDILGDSSYRFSFLLEGGRQTTPNAGLRKADQKEYILSRRHDRDIAPTPFLNIGQSVLSPSRKLMDMYLCSDGLPIDKSPLFQGYAQIVSEYQNRDPRFRQSFLYPFQRYWLGTQPAYFRNWANPTAGGLTYDIAFGILTQTGYSTQKMQQELGGPFGNDFPVFRLAEMYLIYAEAVFEKAGSISDADLDKSINKLRFRVGMPNLTNAFVSANGLDMRNEIRRERTIELFVEGFRYDDLRRWKTAEVEMSQPIRGIKWKGTEFETRAPWKDLIFTLDANGFIVLEAGSKRYLQPLPLRQIVLNPQLTQNPGW
jgi:hypothetical protein